MKACLLRSPARVETNPLEFSDLPIPCRRATKFWFGLTPAESAAQTYMSSRENCRHANHL